MVAYFYDNIKSDYLILEEGIPVIKHKVIKRTISDKRGEVKYKGFRKRNKSTNVKLEYISKGDSVFLANNGVKKSKGDMEADGLNSYYLGRHIIRDGDRPQKIRRASDPMFECYHLNKKIFKNSDVLVDRSVSMTGCFKSNKITLQRTMIPETSSGTSLPSMASIKMYSKAIKTAIRKLNIKTLSKCKKEDMNYLSFNKNTYPGFYYDKYHDCKTKLEASGIAMKVARERWSRISKASKTKTKLKRNKIFPNTFVVGARNKRDYHYEDGDVISSRAVHMPEFHSELNSSVWVEQIAKEIKFNERGPIYLGNSIVKYERLVKDIRNDEFQIEGDWKRFDSRLYINNIIIGLSLLRLYYPLDDEEIDYHFLALFDTIGIKDYITPGGYLYRLVHGLPSGVSCTSLLGSLINLVNLIYCTDEYDLKRIKYIVGGDDFLISVNDSINTDKVIESMINKAESIGQVFKILEKKTKTALNYNERPSFYKYTIDSNEPVINPTALLERVFLPWNRNYDSNEKILSFLIDLFPSLGSPRTYHLIFYEFYSKIFYNVTGQKRDVKDIYSLHYSIYNKIMMGERFYKKKDVGDFINFSYIKNHLETLTRKTKIFILFKKSKKRALKF